MSVPTFDVDALQRDVLHEVEQQYQLLRQQQPTDDWDHCSAHGIDSCYVAFRSIKAAAGVIDRQSLAIIASAGEELCSALRDGMAHWDQGVSALMGQLLAAVRARLNDDALPTTSALSALGCEVRRHISRPESVGLTSLLRQAPDSQRLPGQPVSGRSRPRFGEFLVEQGLIAAGDLLVALVAQERGQAGHLQALVEHSALSSEALWSLLREAERVGVEPLRYAMQKQLLSIPVQDAIRQFLRRSRPPLGQVLVELAMVDRRQVKNWLLDYYDAYRPEVDTARASRQLTRRSRARRHAQLAAARGDDLPAVDPPADSTGDRSPVATDVEPAEAAVAAGDDSLPTAALLPPATPLIGEDELITDFLVVYHADLQDDVEQRLLGLRQLQGEGLRCTLDVVYRSLHSIKGSCGFIEAVVLQTVIHGLEEAVGLLKRHADNLDLGLVDDWTDLLLLGWDYGWELRRAIAEYRDEERMLQHHGAELESYLQRLQCYLQAFAASSVVDEGSLDDLF